MLSGLAFVGALESITPVEGAPAPVNSMEQEEHQEKSELEKQWQKSFDDFLKNFESNIQKISDSAEPQTVVRRAVYEKLSQTRPLENFFGELKEKAPVYYAHILKIKQPPKLAFAFYESPYDNYSADTASYYFKEGVIGLFSRRGSGDSIFVYLHDVKNIGWLDDKLNETGLTKTKLLQPEQIAERATQTLLHELVHALNFRIIEGALNEKYSASLNKNTLSEQATAVLAWHKNALIELVAEGGATAWQLSLERQLGLDHTLTQEHYNAVLAPLFLIAYFGESGLDRGWNDYFEMIYQDKNKPPTLKIFEQWLGKKDLYQAIEDSPVLKKLLIIKEIASQQFHERNFESLFIALVNYAETFPHGLEVLQDYVQSYGQSIFKEVLSPLKMILTDKLAKKIGQARSQRTRPQKNEVGSLFSHLQ